MTFNARLMLRLLSHSFFRSRNTPGRLCPQRVGFLVTQMLLFYPLLGAAHRLAWAADRLLFPGFRRQEVREPVFIAATQRSGTTLLMRTLQRDPQFVPMDLWESLLAPSVVQRKLAWALKALDDRLGQPLQRGWVRLEERWSQMPNARDYFRVHRLSFLQPEEDVQLLLHQAACYDLLAFFPFPELLADYADYSRRVPAKRRRKEMAFYRSMVQRHLYAHGGGRHLSKPPTFSSAMPDLRATFPDAKFIHLVRHPAEVIPSALTLWYGHWRMNGCPGDVRREARILAEVYCLWYRRLHEDLADLPPHRYVRVGYRDLTQNYRQTVHRIYEQLELAMPPALARYLEAEDVRVRAYRSPNKYTLEQWGLSREDLAHLCAGVAEMYGFTF